jgi:hypothetical protein
MLRPRVTHVQDVPQLLLLLLPLLVWLVLTACRRCRAI